MPPTSTQKAQQTAPAAPPALQESSEASEWQWKAEALHSRQQRALASLTNAERQTFFSGEEEAIAHRDLLHALWRADDALQDHLTGGYGNPPYVAPSYRPGDRFYDPDLDD